MRSELYCRDIGGGQPIIVLHGGPDFSHSYLLPELDRLAEAFHLITYDQRGRGRSLGQVRPEDVTIESEVADLEKVRAHFGLESTAVLGHSWGGLLAMEYAIRHPQRVSHLILMNTAPVSHDEHMRQRRERQRTAAADLEQLKALSSTALYEEGDLEADAAYYRIHFRTTLGQSEQLDALIRSLRVDFTPAGVRTARAIEQRLYAETWNRIEYDLHPRLAQLDVPTLLLHGDRDLIPVECVAPIAQAMPASRLVVLKDCGHFPFLERPREVRTELDAFFQTDDPPRRAP